MKRDKKAQLNINFSVIFSVILIIAFVAVAVYAIIMFLNLQKCSETGLFKQNLQESVNRAWSSEETSEIFEGKISKDIERVCFIDLNSKAKGEYKDFYQDVEKSGIKNINMFFYPLRNACEGQKGFQIEHLDVEKITEKDNPKCFKNDNKVVINIEKGFYDSLVNLE